MEGYIGQIIWFAGNFAPKYWAFCNGQTLNIQTNTALFSIVGTTFGGDGITTFKLPDLRGRIAVGTGTGAGVSPVYLGEAAGTEGVVLTTAQMPAHNHLLHAKVAVGSGNGSTDEVSGNVPARTSANNFAPGNSANSQMSGVAISMAATGKGKPVPVVNPYVGIYSIICVYGIYPSRS